MEMPIEKKVELSWVNYIKILCMVLVYLNHSETYAGVRFEIARHFYGPIFVNSFFVVSGYLLFRKQLSLALIEQSWNNWLSDEGKKYLRNILFKLAIPSVLFAAILFLPKQLLRNHSINVIGFMHDTIMGGSMWFTSALTVAEIMIFLILLFRSKSIWTYFAYGVCCAVFSYIIFASGITFCEDPHVPWYYRSGLSAVLFMACGGLYWKYEKKIDTLVKRWKGALFVVLIFIYVIWGLYKYMFFSGNLYKPLNIPTVPIVLVGTYILIWICKKIPSYKAVDYMGRHSIGLYFFSGALPNTMAVLLRKVLPQTAILPISVWAISLLIAFPAVVLINRYMPFMYDLRLLKKKAR